MGRYLGPKYRFVRRVGTPLLGLEKEKRVLSRRRNPPGQVSANFRRRKVSDYGIQLLEKQKLRYMYGIREGFLRRVAARSRHHIGNSGEMLLQKLELRLDNAVFKMGFAPTIWAARQLVSHRKMEVNGKRINIASYSVKPGDEISVTEKSRQMRAIRESLSRNQGTGTAASVPYFSVDRDNLVGRVDHMPTIGEMQIPVKIQLIIEFYAR